MANITNMLNGPSILPNETEVCTLSVDCQEIACTITNFLGSVDLVFELFLLPCFSPPAVRIVYSGIFNYDHTFYQTEEDALHPLNFNQIDIGVKLDHSRDNTIGLQVSALYRYWLYMQPSHCSVFISKHLIVIII